MGLFGAIFGESNSSASTSTTTNQTDSRQIWGQDAINATNGAIVNRITNTTTLDADVANSAIKANSGVLSDALGFGSDALGFGGKTVTSALNFGSDSLASALGFSGKALTAISNANADALSFAESTNKTAQSLTYNSLSDSLSVGQNSLAKAFTFGTGLTDQAFSSLANTENIVSNAYADAKGRGALTDKILIGAIVAMAVVAFAAIKK